MTYRAVAPSKTIKKKRTVASKLVGCKVKIDRAKRHLADLNEAIKLFENRNEYCIVTQIDPQTRIEIYRLNLLEEIPACWGGLIGDAVHNLRSSLDLLINELVIQAGEIPTDKTALPICKSRSNYREEARSRLKGLTTDARRIVDRLKPYDGSNGCQLLWKLHRLDIADKHRLLIPVAAAHQETIFQPRPFAGSEFDPQIGLPTISLKSIKRTFPLKNGDVLFTYGGGPVDQDKTQFKPVIEIAFGEGQIFEGEPVAVTLSKLIEFVERIIIIFERRFFRNDIPRRHPGEA